MKGGGKYETADGLYVIGRMEAVGAWFVWRNEDDVYPEFGERFDTLRAAVTRVEDAYADGLLGPNYPRHGP